MRKIGFIFAILVGLIVVVLVSLSVPSIRTQPKINLSLPEKQKIESLFKKNVFSTTNLLPYRIDEDNIGQTHVRAYQVYQGVTLNEEIILHFDASSGLFESISGHPVPNIPISSGQIVSNANLVAKTMRIIGEDNSYYTGLARPVTVDIKPRLPAVVAAFRARLSPDFWGVQPLDAFLNVYNKNSGTDSPQDWTMAWTITPKGRDYPVIVIDANSGQILYSFNGIMY